MTRTDAILMAIRTLLDARRVELDALQDLRGLVLDLRFDEDSIEPQVVQDHLVRERRKGRRHPETKTV